MLVEYFILIRNIVDYTQIMTHYKNKQTGLTELHCSLLIFSF